MNKNENKTDCFAYINVSTCGALETIDCEKCAFYKSEEKHQNDKLKTERRRLSHTYWDNVNEVKSKVEYWTDYRNTETRKLLSGEGGKLQEIRINKQLTLKEFGNITGYTGEYISTLEKRKTLPRKLKRAMILKFNLPYNYFEK